jgi:hypothetical protein
MVTASTITVAPSVTRKQGVRDRGRVVQLAESKKVAAYENTQVADALKRAMRVCEPEQEEGRNFIAIHITKVSLVQSNANRVNAQQRKGNLREGPEAASNLFRILFSRSGATPQNKRNAYNSEGASGLSMLRKNSGQGRRGRGKSPIFFSRLWPD